MSTPRPRKGSLASSFRYALEGLRYVLWSERNARIDLGIAILAVGAGLWLRLSLLEWALIIVAIALVFAGEMLNTVIELVVDMIMPQRHPLAKHAKDLAAGAILVAAIAAAVIGALVLGPHFLAKLRF